MSWFLLRLYLAECPTNQGNCDKDVIVSLCAARMPLTDALYGILTFLILERKSSTKTERLSFSCIHLLSFLCLCLKTERLTILFPLDKRGIATLNRGYGRKLGKWVVEGWLGFC